MLWSHWNAPQYLVHRSTEPFPIDIRLRVQARLSHEGGAAGTSPDQVRLTNMTSDQAIAIVETVRRDPSVRRWTEANNRLILCMERMRLNGENQWTRTGLANALRQIRHVDRVIMGGRWGGKRYEPCQVGRN